MPHDICEPFVHTRPNSLLRSSIPHLDPLPRMGPCYVLNEETSSELCNKKKEKLQVKRCSLPTESETSETESEHEVKNQPKKMDVTDFECSLCSGIFYQPVTTACGHTYCKSCILSALSYSIMCPLCRSNLQSSVAGAPGDNNLAVNFVIMSVIEKNFPLEYRERLEEELQEVKRKQEREERAREREQEIQNQEIDQVSPWSFCFPYITKTCFALGSVMC